MIKKTNVNVSGPHRTSDHVFLRPRHPRPEQVHEQTETAAGRVRSRKAERSHSGDRYGAQQRGIPE